MHKRMPTLLAVAAIVAVAAASASPGGHAPTAAGPPGASAPGLAKAEAALERHRDKLLDKPGIAGVAVVLNNAGKAVLRVYKEERDAADVPSTLDGVGVESVTTGIIQPRAPTDRFPRPVPIGVSSGLQDISTGTIGARVTDGTNVYALSNNHVFAGINTGNVGDGIIQPGAADGGSDPADRIGTLYAYQPINFDAGSTNTIDAAIALTSTANVGTSTPSDGYGTPSAVTTQAYLGQPVQKYGRTTGLQLGTVAGLDVAVDVCYLLLFNTCLEQARFVNQVSVSPGTFSAPGDSGSLIVSQNGNQPVALLFAGGDGLTIGNPIDAVLQHFGVTIDGSVPTNGPPGAPASLAASAGNAQVSLSWSAPSADGGSPITNYKLYRGTSAGTETFLANAGTSTAYTDTSAANGTTYYYTVSAVNAVGEGPLSNEVNATPAAPATVPGAPASLAASAGNAQVSLSWSAPSADGGSPITNYKLYRGTSAGTETFLANAGTSTAYTDTSAANGTTYYYKVSAENALGEGPLSNEVNATPAALVPPATPLPVLDGFNRANENPLSDGGRWSNAVNGGVETGLNVSSNQLACSASSTCTAWRNNTQYGPDSEVWATVSTLPGTSNAVRLYARLQQPGTSGYDGYMLRTNQLSGTDEVYLERIDNSAVVRLATLSQELAPGDVLLLRVSGSTVEAWRNNGTSWSRLGVVTDSTYAGAGYVGVGIRGTTGRLDDFGARTMGAAATVPGAPASLAASAGNAQVSLSWSAPSADGGSPITNYKLYRGTSAGTETFLANAGTSTAYTDTSAANGTTYYYTVSAVNAVGEGPLSNEVNASPTDLVPPAPLPSPLDTFNRANENPLSFGGRWGNGILGSSERSLKVVSNQLASDRTTTATAWWKPALLGPDCEAWATITTLPGNGNAVRLYTRLQTPGSSAVDGYMLLFTQSSGTDSLTFYRITNGALTSLATVSGEVTVGSRLLFRARGTALEAWVQAGSTWTRLGRTTDATYSAAGYVGVGIRAKTGRLDDFGAR